MISNEAQRTLPKPLNGLGFITPDITRPIGTLAGPGTAMAVGVLGLTVSIAAPLYGAYRGAKRSPGWAAGGAAIGMVAGGIVSALLGLVVVGAAASK